MSWCLIRKGLDLIEKDLDSNKNSYGNSSQSKDTQSLTSGKLKKTKRLKKNGGANLFSQRKVKNALQLHKKKVNQGDKTNQNLSQVRRIDSCFNSDESAQKVKQYHVKKLFKKTPKDSGNLEKALKGSQSESVFTEEDFEKMNDKWLSLA